MGHIVVGVDESQGAAAALQWSVREAELRGWKVTAVLAWGWLDQHHRVRGPRFDPAYGEEDAQSALTSSITAAIGGEAAAVEQRVVCDFPARALLAAAADADLLVLGPRGLGGFRGLVLGSVSNQCLHHSPVPTAIVHDLPPSVGSEREHIVVGVDGSEASRAALGWALDEARLRHATVDAVHGWDVPFSSDPFASFPSEPTVFEDSARAVLDDAVDADDTSGLPTPVGRVLVPGGAAGAILETAKGADLIVVGSRSRGGFGGLLLGSVSHQVAHHARSPVVVIPSKTRSSGVSGPGRTDLHSTESA